MGAYIVRISAIKVHSSYSSVMDLFEEEELVDDTRAKLVDYEDDSVRPAAGGGRHAMFNVEMKESEDEYYAGEPVSRSELLNVSSPENELDSESGRL